MLVSWCDVPSRAQQHRSAASAHQDNTKTSDDTIQALVLDLLFFLGATNISIKMKNPECVPLYRLAGQNKIMNVHNIFPFWGWDQPVLQLEARSIFKALFFFDMICIRKAALSYSFSLCNNTAVDGDANGEPPPPAHTAQHTGVEKKGM